MSTASIVSEKPSLPKLAAAEISLYTLMFNSLAKVCPSIALFSPLSGICKSILDWSKIEGTNFSTEVSLNFSFAFLMKSTYSLSFDSKM